MKSSIIIKLSFYIAFFSCLSLTHACQIEQIVAELSLSQKISQILIWGAEGKTPQEFQIPCDGIGGLIVFNRNLNDPEQWRDLCAAMQSEPYALKVSLAAHQQQALIKPFIAIDEEGGKVTRLSQIESFKQSLQDKEIPFPSAEKISTKSALEAQKIMGAMTSFLKHYGINMNFAPVVDVLPTDLPANSSNWMKKLERCYGDTAEKVTLYASLMVQEMTKQNIIPVLKHFPGHGRIDGDSHQGFVDATKTASPEELKPYKNILKDYAEVPVMIAHIFNAEIDKQWPATLSRSHINILREKLKFKGVVISDDMLMGALQEALHKDGKSFFDGLLMALMAGCDLLIISNNPISVGNKIAKEPWTTKSVSYTELIKFLTAEAEAKPEVKSRIDQACAKVLALKNRYNLIVK